MKLTELLLPELYQTSATSAIMLWLATSKFYEDVYIMARSEQEAKDKLLETIRQWWSSEEQALKDVEEFKIRLLTENVI